LGEGLHRGAINIEGKENLMETLVERFNFNVKWITLKNGGLNWGIVSHQRKKIEDYKAKVTET